MDAPNYSCYLKVYNLNCYIFQIKMTRRPDSAKTQVTKQTVDSQHSKRDLNLSKFSQTVSEGVSIYGQKADTFEKYVAEKDKDPKFKHLKSKLEVIQQKATKEQPQKINNKPFQIKKGKTIDKTKNQKVQEKTQRQEKVQKNAEHPTSSKGFAQRNKKIMDSLNPVKVQKNKEVEKPKELNKAKIDFGSFKVNNQKPKQIKRSIKIQTKKQQQKKQVSVVKKEQMVASPAKQQNNKKGKTQKQTLRQNQLRNLQNFVNDVQQRNLLNFPANYDMMINRMSTSRVSDLQKIDLDEFLNDPTQGQYQILMKKIRANDSKLQKQKVQQQSINLQDVITDDYDDDQNQQQDDASIYASLSAQEMKKRNAFITEILAGKISKQEIQKFQEMNRSTMRMYKIDHEKQEDDIEFSEINIVKKQSNRLIQRNKLQAAGKLYRDCDYLSEQHQQRIEELLSSNLIESPFEFNQLSNMQNRRIDEGIRMYRQMNASEEIGQILNDESLPKDPQLKKQAQKKVLKERISSVNNRLGSVDKIVVTKNKIQALIKKFEHTKKSSNYYSMSEHNQLKLNQQLKRLKQAQQILQKLGEKQNMQDLINQIDKQYRQLQQQIKIANQMDAKELMKIQKDRLRRKLREVEQIQKISRQLGDEIDLIENTKRQVQQSLRSYDNVESLQIDQLRCEGYNQNQTLQDLDRLITSKWQSDNNQNQN